MRCPGARHQARRSRHRHPGRVGNRSRRSLRRGLDAGVDSRGDRGDETLRRDSDPRCRGYRDGAANGGGDGHGRPRRLDRFGVAHNRGGGDRAGGQGEVPGCQFTADRSFAESHRQVHAPTAFAVDRCLAFGGSARPIADAAAATHQRARAWQDRSSRRNRTPRRQAVDDLFRRPGRGADEPGAVRPAGGLRLHGGFPRGHRAVERVHGG